VRGKYIFHLMDF